jgi:hypothetical protein
VITVATTARQYAFSVAFFAFPAPFFFLFSTPLVKISFRFSFRFIHVPPFAPAPGHFFSGWVKIIRRPSGILSGYVRSDAFSFD